MSTENKTQQVGENPAWRDELVREAHARGLMEGMNSPRPQQVGEVQGDALAAFVRLAQQRKAELGELSPEMEKCLQDGVQALADRKHVDDEIAGLRALLAKRQGGSITADWVLGYLNTDAPEDSRDAIRNAFTEWNALAATGKQQVGEVQGGALAAFNECLTPALRVPETAAYRIAILAAVEAARQPGAQVPVAFDYPEFHAEGMGCGLEDRNITDRYEAMRYGFDEALEQMATTLGSLGPLYAVPPAQPGAQFARQLIDSDAPNYIGEVYDTEKGDIEVVARYVGGKYPPAQGIDLGQLREAVEMAMEAPIKGRAQRQRLVDMLALIDQRDAAKAPK